MTICSSHSSVSPRLSAMLSTQSGIGLSSKLWPENRTRAVLRWGRVPPSPGGISTGGTSTGGTLPESAFGGVTLPGGESGSVVPPPAAGGSSAAVEPPLPAGPGARVGSGLQLVRTTPAGSHSADSQRRLRRVGCSKAPP
jgi:hypothetical protein